MAFQINPALAQALLGPLGTSLNGGRLYIFAGTIPADPNVALNMVTTHTEVAELTLNGGGVTGLTFGAASGAVISKAPAEQWSGLVAFDGFVVGPGTITPTFFRFCPSGDAGRVAGVGARLQGTVGGPASTADLKLGSDTLTDNGVNTTGCALFNFRLSSLS